MVKIKLQTNKEIYLDGLLMAQLDSLIFNITKDWDFVIIVTGDRQVRTGKSVIGMSIGAYLAHRLKTKFTLDNVFFDSQDMIDAAQELPKNSVLIYDEGRESLAATKSSKTLQRDLLDYFSECGQLNHIFIVILPDFFELKENMAVARSEFLINVYRKNVNVLSDIYKEGKKLPLVRFDRGYFEFFSRKKKQLLYDLSKSTKKKNYSIVNCNFYGRFTNNYPLDEQLYRERKKEALARFKERKEKEKESAKDVFRDRVILNLSSQGLSAPKIKDILEDEYSYLISASLISRVIRNYKERKNEE